MSTDDGAAGAMLALLGALAGLAAQAAAPAGKARVVGVALQPDALRLELALEGLGLLDGTYPVLLRLETVTAERSLGRLELPAHARLGRLLGKGLGLLPRGPINDALQRAFGGAVRLEGEQVVVEHRACAERLLGRSAT